MTQQELLRQISWHLRNREAKAVSTCTAVDNSQLDVRMRDDSRYIIKVERVNPAEAQRMHELIRPKQLAALRIIADGAGLNAEEFTRTMFEGLRPEELTIAAGSKAMTMLAILATLVTIDAPMSISAINSHQRKSLDSAALISALEKLRDAGYIQHDKQGIIDMYAVVAEAIERNRTAGLSGAPGDFFVRSGEKMETMSAREFNEAYKFPDEK